MPKSPIPFTQKRKLAARRMLRKINWMLRKMYNHGYLFERTEQQLLYARAWYEA